MNEPYPGGPGDGYQPLPGGRRQPDQANQPNHWPNDDWFGPQRGQERGPAPREVSGERGFSGERGPGGRRYGSHRRPELNQTTVDQLTVVEQPAALDPEGRMARRNQLPIKLNKAQIKRNWALIAGVVFFLVDTVLMVEGFAGSVGNASRILVIFIWLISLVAVALLWLRGSSKFHIQNPFVRVEDRTHQR